MKRKPILMMILPLVVVIVIILVALPAKEGISAQTGEEYKFDDAVLSGDGYQLTTLSWQVSGEVRGGGYTLFSPMTTVLRGSGCCCTFLPCVMKE
jgi:hypothetical protein